MNQRRLLGLVLAGVLLLTTAGQPALACYDTTATESRAANLIVFLVEDFGFGTQNLARLALAGPENRLKLESMPYVGVMNLFGRTALGVDERAALWPLVWGLRADAGETPPGAAGRASWVNLVRASNRSVGLVTDGRLDEEVWPLGALAQPSSGVDRLATLVKNPPAFLFGWTPAEARWAEQVAVTSGGSLKASATWGAASAGPAWYLLPGAPANPLVEEGTPTLAQVVERALGELKQDPDGFVLVVHAGELGRALRQRDLPLAVAQLSLFDEAVGQALTFAETAEGTAVLTVSTGDPANLTLLEGFSASKLDSLQQPLSRVAAEVKRAASPEAAVAAIQKGLGLEVTAAEAAAWQGWPEAQIRSALADREAAFLRVAFNTARQAVGPAPVFAYGPGAWVYGRLFEATELPSLIAGQLWLDPQGLVVGAAAQADAGTGAVR